MTAPLAAAITEAQATGAQAVIHCGDLIGVNTLLDSPNLGIPVHAIHGNNIGDVAALYRIMEIANGLFNYYEPEAALEFSGRRIFVAHIPHYGKAFARTGDHDLVCHSHSHTAHDGSGSGRPPHPAEKIAGHCGLAVPSPLLEEGMGVALRKRRFIRHPLENGEPVL